MDINALFHIPERCILNNRIHKKVVLENAELKATEKKLIREGIEQMTWLAAIKPANSNIPAFEDETWIYDEVHWILVLLKTPDKYKRIAELLQKVIPYPLVLVFQQAEKLAVNLAEKRINQNDATKRTLEGMETTPWFNWKEGVGRQFVDSLSYEQQSIRNLKAHYEDLLRCIIAFQSAQMTGRFEVPDHGKTQQTVEQLGRIRQLEEEMTHLRSALKKESQFNRKVDLNVQLKKLEQTKNELIQKI